MTPVFLVISYDIPDDKRRLKLSRLLLDHGGERVQYSVFECHITQRNLERLRQRIERIYDAEKDSVRFYFLCESCRPKALYMGVAKPVEEPGLIIL